MSASLPRCLNLDTSERGWIPTRCPTYDVFNLDFELFSGFELIHPSYTCFNVHLEILIWLYKMGFDKEHTPSGLWLI